MRFITFFELAKTWGWLVLLTALILYLVSLIRKRKRERLVLELGSLGLNRKNLANRREIIPPVFKEDNSKIVFLKYNPECSDIEWWKNKKGALESIFGYEFISIEQKLLRNKQSHIYLIKNALPEIVPFESCPRLIPMESWFGVTQFLSNLKFDLQSKSSIFINGKPDSGKTIGICSATETYVRRHLYNVKINIITTKPTDYLYFLNSRKHDVRLVDLTEGDFAESIVKAVACFEEMAVLEGEFKAIVKREGIVNPDLLKANRLRQEGYVFKTQRQFYILDEAQDYLKIHKSDSKKVKDAKQKLIDTTYSHIRRTSRYLSCPIIVAGQSDLETDIDIPIKLFSTRISSETSPSMSEAITGDRKLLVDPSFTKGKFFCSTKEGRYIFRFPFFRPEEEESDGN